MTLNDYQKMALTTALSSGDKTKDLSHWALGTIGEAGEVAEKVKKIIRDKNSDISEEDRVELTKELGDVLWYLAVFADFLDVEFEEVASKNIEKLASRQKRNKLGGSGDNR